MNQGIKILLLGFGSCTRVSKSWSWVLVLESQPYSWGFGSCIRVSKSWSWVLVLELGYLNLGLGFWFLN